MITIFKNIWSKSPFYIDIDIALARIKNGNSAHQCELVRTALDKERAQELKKHLPSVCFSGKFKKDRQDEDLFEHSGYLILDFDHVADVQETKRQAMSHDFVYASWISPSGTGVKALVKIADGSKHREHFLAIQDVIPYLDPTGANPSRVCYESVDADILINKKAKPFTKIKKIERVVEKIKKENSIEIFNNILKWLSNKGTAFVTGERNIFIFKLASACCRFGIDSDDCFNLCNMSILANDNTFTNKEAENTIKSAYKKNAQNYGSASFEENRLIDKISKKEVEIVNEDIYDLEIAPKDVIFGEQVKSEAIKIFLNGYGSACTTFVPEIDHHFKWKKGELTVLSGIGNYGKSTMLKYLLLLQAIKLNKKFAMFVPEDCPAEEFYHELVEMYFGQSCTPENENRPSQAKYEKIYDYISAHFFFVYPKDFAPTPEYIKERFLELIIKEKIDGCIVDPFNQLQNDYKSTGGRSDKYLEVILSDFSRFAQNNNCLFVIICHPKQLSKTASGNYECPDVFDLADGAMWNNKADNILIYHMPLRQTEPTAPVCEFHSKKIRRRKIVGQPGFITFEYALKRRRYFIGQKDYLAIAISETDEGKQFGLAENIDFLSEPPLRMASPREPKENLEPF